MLTNLQIQALGDLFLCGDSLEETAQRHQLDLEELRSLYAEFRAYGLGGGSPNLRAIQRQDPIESDPLVIQCKLGLLHLEEIRKTALRPFIERDRRQAAQAEPAASSLTMEDLKSLDLAMKSIDRSIRIQLTLTHRIDTLTSPPFNRDATRSANTSRAPQNSQHAPKDTPERREHSASPREEIPNSPHRPYTPYPTHTPIPTPTAPPHHRNSDAQKLPQRSASSPPPPAPDEPLHSLTEQEASDYLQSLVDELYSEGPNPTPEKWQQVFGDADSDPYINELDQLYKDLDAKYNPNSPYKQPPTPHQRE